MLSVEFRARLALLVVATLPIALAQTRQPWTTSHLEGTPEPPHAFVSEQAFPRLVFNEGLELARVPGSDQLLVVERRGRIASFSTHDPDATAREVLDLRSAQPQIANAYGIALSPRFRETRDLFVCYTLVAGRPDGTRVARFKLTSIDPLRADPQSEEIIISWISGGHNGGNLQFGPDGYLYVSAGDSGPAAPPDPINTGQDPSDLMSSIMRIDVDHRDPGKNYRIPPDNPWAHTGPAQKIRPELWAFGLRNPWKMSFDRATGNLWCGDVGWELWEMIDLVRRGENYGWSAFEASQPVKPQLANPLVPISPPVAAHPHSEAASITGGFVYHGKQYPELAGAYVYGDYVTGKIWALWHDGHAVTRREEIADTPHAIVTFGQPDDGELYFLHYGDRTTVHRLVRNPHAAPVGAFPRTLSATGLFVDVAAQTPAAGVYPFSIATPQWQDGAEATRWIALRDRSRIEPDPDPERRLRTQVEVASAWPAGAVLARTVRLGQLAPTPAERAKPIETQLLHYDGENWHAYTYQWNEDGTDAALVPEGGAEITLRVAADPHAAGPRVRNYQWRFYSRAECLRCHNARHEGPLAFTPSQLRGAGRDQPAAFEKLGLVPDTFFAPHRRGDDQFPSEDRPARTWLQVNCSPCHSPNSGGSVAAFFGANMRLDRMNAVDVPPTQGGLGLKNPKIIDPGRPWNSVLAVRLAKLGSGHMPLAGSHEVDVEGLKRIEDWIARMPPTSPVAPPAEVASDSASLARELASVEGAMRLRRAIDDGKLGAAPRAKAFEIAWASPEPTVRDIFERFKPDDRRERVLGATIDPAEILRVSGDPARGAKLVTPAGRLATCLACHVIGGQGSRFGPDLTHLGATQAPAQILESILQPSKTIAPLFRATVVELRGGVTHVGFVRARGVAEIVLSAAAGPSLKFPKADIVSETALPTSLMPEGLLQGLTPQEAADLVAYLASLK